MSDLRITFAGQTFMFEPGQTVRIGRSPDNSVIVSDPIVSRDHARITWRSDGWVLDDLGKGRTFVGGLPIASVAVQQALDVNLANPRGPELRVELADEELASQDQADTSPRTVATDRPEAGSQAAPAGADASATGTTRHPSAIHREELWRGDISGSPSACFCRWTSESARTSRSILSASVRSSRTTSTTRCPCCRASRSSSVAARSSRRLSSVAERSSRTFSSELRVAPRISGDGSGVLSPMLTICGCKPIAAFERAPSNARHPSEVCFDRRWMRPWRSMTRSAYRHQSRGPP